MAHHSLDKEELDFRLNTIIKAEDIPSMQTNIMETISDPSPESITGILESNMDIVLGNQLSSLEAEAQKEPSSPGSEMRKKRGRKPIRPNDPIKKKTEEKDKY